MHRQTLSVATCLSAVFEDPSGYGRIIREGDSDTLKAIVEHKDASEEIRQIREVNSGTFCFDNQHLFDAIEQIGKDNSQGEYYLTDAVKILHDKGLRVSVVTAINPDEVRGVNSTEQLNELAARFVK
jgi:bifunctional UDP-N-acetylglucosamine pyrophosphorylase/glucosamine-1-phosphate N-acetyltransferase